MPIDNDHSQEPSNDECGCDLIALCRRRQALCRLWLFAYARIPDDGGRAARDEEAHLAMLSAAIDPV